MKKINPVLCVILVSFLMQSCDKNENDSNDEVSFIIKDELTSEPVQYARVDLFTTKEGSEWEKNFTAYSDMNGIARIQYDMNYPHFAELMVTDWGYYEWYNTKDFSRINSTGSNKIILKKRNSYIKFHYNTQSQVASTDSVTVSAQNISYTSSSDTYTFPIGFANNLFILYETSGYYHITSSIKRNNVMVSDSSFYINVLLKDTAQVQINY